MRNVLHHFIHKIPTFSVIILCLPRTKYKVFKGIYYLLHPVSLKTGGLTFQSFLCLKSFKPPKAKCGIIYRWQIARVSISEC